jgi:hypothetical protein
MFLTNDSEIGAVRARGSKTFLLKPLKYLYMYRMYVCIQAVPRVQRGLIDRGNV